MWFWSTFIPKWATPNPPITTHELSFLIHAHQNSPLVIPERDCSKIEPSIKLHKKSYALQFIYGELGVKGKPGVLMANSSTAPIFNQKKGIQSG